MKTVNQLREDTSKMIDELMAGKMNPKAANAAANLMRVHLESYRLQVRIFELAGEKPSAELRALLCPSDALQLKAA